MAHAAQLAVAWLAGATFRFAGAAPQPCGAVDSGSVRHCPADPDAFDGDEASLLAVAREQRGRRVEEAALSTAGASRVDKRLLECGLSPVGYDPSRCFDDPSDVPDTFRAGLTLHSGQSVVVSVHRDWAPPFAQRFWQLVKLGWYRDNALYRVDYRNQSKRFVMQWGINGDPVVQKAWDDHKVSNATAPAGKSNTRGRVAFGMGAVMCNKSAGADDPCAPLRPNCTAEDYCGKGFGQDIFISFDDNSRLDAHGFRPFGEVEGLGMQTLDAVGNLLGNTYGEVADLCGDPRADSAYCVQKAGCVPGNGQDCLAGVNSTTFTAEGNPYIERGFGLMYQMRIKDFGLCASGTPGDTCCSPEE